MPKLLLNIDVPDIHEAVRFYTEAFGLSVGRRIGKDIAELLGAEAPIYLLEKPSRTPAFSAATSKRDYERHWTPVHLDFVVDDLETALQRARAAGATVESAVSDHAWGSFLVLSDPFGHGVCLVQFKGRGYDERDEA
jgi:predicted enzyme related to lactoylglutathione lyase